VFVKCIVGREKLPTWDRLWDDFIQEEIREGSQRGEQKKKSEDEENLALASKSKGKSKKSFAEGTSSKQGSKKKFDTSKSNALLAISLDILPANVPTRRRENPRSRWLLQLIWMHLQPDLRMSFHS
jgi:hypothetical protein